jgi:hypothetical protein
MIIDWNAGAVEPQASTGGSAWNWVATPALGGGGERLRRGPTFRWPKHEPTVRPSRAPTTYKHRSRWLLQTPTVRCHAALLKSEQAQVRLGSTDWTIRVQPNLVVVRHAALEAPQPALHWQRALVRGYMAKALLPDPEAGADAEVVWTDHHVVGADAGLKLCYDVVHHSLWPRLRQKMEEMFWTFLDDD